MSDKLMPFDYEGKQMRTVIIKDDPWFIAKDVCDILELGNVGQAIIRLDADEKNSIILNDGTPGNPNMVVINEPGLYSLILSSRKSEAKMFKRWVTHDVIPSIRKTGAYNLAPKTYSEALRALADEYDRNQELQSQVAIMAPKADFFDAVADSQDAIQIGDAAKVLNVPGVGRNKLFSILRQKGILMKDNIPYQEYIDRGYFRTIEQKWTVGGETRISIKTLVYQKGLDYIRRVITKSA